LIWLRSSAWLEHWTFNPGVGGSNPLEAILSHENNNPFKLKLDNFFMRKDLLLLTKDELPILHDICFQIPIHPKLLNLDIKINPLTAKEIFPQVAEEWRSDLIEHLPMEKDLEKRKWYEEVFLKKEGIKIEYGRQFFGIWEDEIQLADNGLVVGFSISRNAGGSLYFDKEEMNCQSLPIFGKPYIKFSDEKAKEFEFEKNRFFVYSPHNVDYYPGALFLRNWAIRYMNEVFKEIKD
jgi:hypothetical protein